jgi:GNAT superfamily N-acetyltransferase
MQAMKQPSLFMIRTTDQALDDALAERGYAVIDPVTIYTASAASIARPLPPITCFEVFPPLAIMREIWEAGGLGTARVDVMTRATGAKTAIFARANGRAAGVAYVGLHKDTAMLHALEVKKSARRQGVAVNIMRATANWTLDQGGKELSLVVLTANTAAGALYTSLGMKPVGQYHYRILKPEGSLQVEK